MVLISNLPRSVPVHYLDVKLTGTTSNRDGLGAIVTVTAGGVTLTKVMDGKSGYLSHSVMPLYFGLGDAIAVTRSRSSGRRASIRRWPLRWPSTAS